MKKGEDIREVSEPSEKLVRKIKEEIERLGRAMEKEDIVRILKEYERDRMKKRREEDLFGDLEGMEAESGLATNIRNARHLACSIREHIDPGHINSCDDLFQILEHEIEMVKKWIKIEKASRS